MRRSSMITALASMLLASGCGGERPRVEIALPDPAQRAGCAVDFPPLPELPALAPFTIPAGTAIVVGGVREILTADTRAVLVSRIQERDTIVADYVIEGARGAWHGCRTVVGYDDDWIAGMAKAHSDKRR